MASVEDLRDPARFSEIAWTLNGASRKMIVYDEVEPSEKIKGYDEGITLNDHQNPEKLHQMLVGYRTGDGQAPKIDGTERWFVRSITPALQCVRNGTGNRRVVPDFAWSKFCTRVRSRRRDGGRPVELRHTSLQATA